ncbi:MAG: hypothetical protein ACLQLH_03515 [Terracidiphilus sp.]
MADLQAGVGAIAVAIEQVYNDPQLLVEQDAVLDGLISDSGRAEMVSAHTYRLTFQDAIPGAVAAISLDNPAVNFPTPGASDWQSGTMAPVAWTVPIGWTKLAELAGKPNLTVVNVVAKQMADAIRRVRQFRDMILCAGEGTGILGTVTAVASPTVTFTTTDFGARLINKGQAIDFYNGTTFVITSNVLSVNSGVGSAQTITVDTCAGVVGGYVARVTGLTSGSPTFVYGIPYWLSNATTGLRAGIDSSQAANNFIVANGVNANSSTITPPLFRLPLDQIKQALGLEAIKGSKFKIQMHPAQKAQYEQLAGQFFSITRPDGKMGSYDLLSDSDPTISGNMILENIHAHIQRIDYLNLDRWGKIKWGNPPFWFTSEGRRVFQQVGTNGQITAGAASFMVDTVNYYVDNPKSMSSIYSAKQPTGY